MRRHSLPLLLLLITMLALPASAATISYQATHVAGTTWRYDYAVTNDGAIATQVRLFDILFEPALYAEASLTIESAPGLSASWDQMILASGIGVPAAFDALAAGGGIGIGQSVSGFAVRFTWLGSGTPGAQAFEIYDPGTFDLSGRGVTAAVPAPPAAWLVGAGLLFAARRASRRSMR